MEYTKNDMRLVRIKFILQSCYRIVSQLLSVLSGIKYATRMSNCHHTCFSRWRHHIHYRSAVRDGVGQKTPHDLIGFCVECCAVGYFVLLSLVQRHALVFLCACLRRNVNRQCIFLHTRGKWIPSTKLCAPEQANTDEDCLAHRTPFGPERAV